MARIEEKFDGLDIEALRSDMLQSGADFRDTAEMLQAFLWGHGYGVSRQAAIDSACKVAGAGCAIHVIEDELDRLSLAA